MRHRKVVVSTSPVRSDQPAGFGASISLLTKVTKLTICAEAKHRAVESELRSWSCIVCVPEIKWRPPIPPPRKPMKPEQILEQFASTVGLVNRKKFLRDEDRYHQIVDAYNMAQAI